MQQHLIESIRTCPSYGRITRARRRFCLALTALMIAAYYGFIVLVALVPQWLAQPLYGGAVTSVGMALGIAVILISVGLTGAYVVRSNRTFDPLMDELIAQSRQGD
ncbi:DUF485 domain-containing protein [Trinickia violacea]|uniref:DUF485 domain-containing protein n=1 Tax=Trinickia violacea TaxID=2571746 RepID=A0A4P8J0L5_9BURK|nr:DUF485 domain-containing protein [Trinickia violacea]QCP54471.1 DUF485 domain-containing protein [Trinickia violacea]